ncbi:ATP-binding protein [Williamwhitmania taraxaci]|uniref:histidine kinase n=1 Tax=Williamwhitmania taraxaci TaxID=1640674 RepID=A0A1G6U176_9BACT|nr:ATP-binding protein [Williamwhitmania taraxaci]SDD35140.1 Signal transduction histidine kinase [Williamwhitmania taraxaci]
MSFKDDTLTLTDKVSILRLVSIFSEVPAEVLADIAMVSTQHSLPAESIIINKGDMDFALYVVIHGKVKVHAGDHIFTTFSNNDYFGEYALIDSSPRSATVTTLEPTEVLRLDQTHFNQIIASNKKITQGILNGLIMRLRDYNVLQSELTKKGEEIKLQRDVLEKQRKELEVLNATKDKFFAIIAHDLRNPFSTVLGLSELLAREFENFDSDRLKEFINQIYKYSNNTFNLLENLLQWSMVQTGRMPLRPKVVDLFEVVMENIELLRGNATNKEISLIGPEEGEWFSYVDVNMITTVVRNLISNAIKFTEVGGFVKVKFEQDDRFVTVSVSDSGVGISAIDLSKLFKLDSNPTTIGTSQEKGTGLGLILCKEFVERNGGKVWVESILGEGTTFRFTAPRISSH